jgi:hypothetical protein
LNLFKKPLCGTDTRLIFIFASLLYILISVIINEFIISGELYYNTYADRLSIDRINKLIHLKEKWEWKGYALIPVLLLIKLLLITLSIEIGVILLDYKVSFNKIFRVVLIAELVTITAQVIRNTFLFFLDFDTFDEIYNFYPLSVLSLINTNSVDTWLIYPLKLANVFTIIYFIVLAYGLSFILRKKPVKMLLFSLSTYGLCLLIWTMLIMFINIYFS